MLPFILLIEDSDEDFVALQRALKHAQITYTIQRCTKGDDALDYLYRRGRYSNRQPTAQPALILLDLNLPGTDGRRVLAQIKSDPMLRMIPVVIITTSSNPKDVISCYHNGANSYFVKSINFEKFRRQINILTEYWLNATVLPVSLEEHDE